ncbi:MAG: SelT/SelW/SelH family protein [Acetobacteraceae bacterium]
MMVGIEYCVPCGYEPRARAARALIQQKKPDAEIALKMGSGGVFEIMVDGKLRFSKRASGHLPSDQEVLATLD